MSNTRTPPIQGGFHIFVIPTVDVKQTTFNTIPPTMIATNQLRIVGRGNNGDVSCCSWAFSSKSRKAVVRDLRDLANWIENNAIED